MPATRSFWPLMRGVRLLMKHFAILLILLYASTAHAESSIQIPCSESPESAVLSVPKPADKFLHVLCSKFGHVVTPTTGWFWTPPGTYAPRFFPAQMVQDNPESVGNSVFFESIQVNELAGDDAKAKWSPLAEVFPEDTYPKKALEIVARSNSGGAHKIYIFPNSWGYSCGRGCKKTSVFLMVSQTKEAPRWWSSNLTSACSRTFSLAALLKTPLMRGVMIQLNSTKK